MDRCLLPFHLAFIKIFHFSFAIEEKKPISSRRQTRFANTPHFVETNTRVSKRPIPAFRREKSQDGFHQGILPNYEKRKMRNEK
jgi:hypothetical protein